MERPTSITLKARVCKGRNEFTTWSFIEVYVMGKWRGTTYYCCSYERAKNTMTTPPSKKICERVIEIIRSRTGWEKSGYHPEIELEWVEPDITTDFVLVTAR